MLGERTLIDKWLGVMALALFSAASLAALLAQTTEQVHKPMKLPNQRRARRISC